jgi:hypothetical protein
MTKAGKGKTRLTPEMLQRLRAIGLDPDDMTDEQLRALESLEEPQKHHWFVKLFLYVGGILFILGLLSILSANWLPAIGYAMLGLIVWYVAYRIQGRLATKRFLEASIRKDISERLRERTIPARRITYVCGQYSQLKLLDGTTVFVETLPQSLRVSKMVLRSIPTKTLWEYKLPFEIRTPTQPSDIAKELLDLVLQSIAHCKTLTELKQKLQSETGTVLEDYLYREG